MTWVVVVVVVFVNNRDGSKIRCERRMGRWSTWGGRLGTAHGRTRERLEAPVPLYLPEVHGAHGACGGRAALVRLYG